MKSIRRTTNGCNRQRVEDYQAQVTRIPALTDTMKVAGVGFGVMGISHFCADIHPLGICLIAVAWKTIDVPKTLATCK